MHTEKMVVELNINEVLPNRFQPRIKFNEDAIKELANSIRQYGVINPIVVRKVFDKYEIIAGERRYKASVVAGKQTIPAIVVDLNDKDSAEIALIENVQRMDLTPIEEAISYKKVLDMGYRQEELAQKLGKKQSTIANKLRLLNLSDDVQEALLDGKISERHARSLLRIKNNDVQAQMLNKIINDRLTVRQADEEINKMNNDVQNNIFQGAQTSTRPISENIFNDSVQGLNPIIGENMTSTPLNENVDSFANNSVGEENNLFTPSNELNKSIFNVNPSANVVNPINVDKIEEGARDLFAPDKPAADMGTLLQVDKNIEAVNAAAPVSVANTAPDFVPGKFFGLMDDEPTNNSSINKPLPAEDNKFDFSFNSQSAPSMPVQANSFGPDKTVEQSDTLRELLETSNSTSELPKEEKMEPYANYEKQEATNAAAMASNPYKMVDIDFDGKERGTETPQIDIPKKDIRNAIELIRQNASQLETLGYTVDTEEIDFEDKYQITIKINK